MRKAYFSVFVFLSFSISHLVAQDYSILASNYFNAKDDSITYTLFQGRGLDTMQIAPEAVSGISLFSYLQGGKKIADMEVDSANFVRFAAVQQHAGQSLLTLEFSGGKVVHDQITVEEFANTENMSDLGTVIDSSGFTTEYTANTFFVAKALTITDKHNGSLNSRKEGDSQLEIVLQQNPYKLLYGDDIIALAYLNGKPQPGVSVTIYTRASNGQVYAARYRSNAEGKFFFKLNRSGLWLVQAVYANSSEEEGVDYNFYQSSYSFSFK